MKTQLLALTVLLLSIATNAQTNTVQLDSTQALLFAATTYTYPNRQHFVYGSDTIWFEAICNTHSLHYEFESLPLGSETPRLVDSIDLNNDGVKELFLYREWSCQSGPRVKDGTLEMINEFGVGTSTEWYGNYEVWDIKNKHQIFMFTSLNRYQRIVSTNVVTSGGFEYDVRINNKGSIQFEKLNKMENEENTDGTYKYDAATGTYILKN